MSWEPGPVSPVMTSWPRPSNSTTSAGRQELNAKSENGNDWLKSTVNDGGMTEGGCDVGAEGGVSHATQAKAKAKSATRFMVLPPVEWTVRTWGTGATTAKGRTNPR